MKHKVNCLLLLILIGFIPILISCTASSEVNLEPTKGKFYIPMFTLSEPEYIVDSFEIYKIPVTALTNKNINEISTVVKSENINGFESFDAIGVIALKIKKKYAYVRLDDKENKTILKSDDQIVDYLPESLQKINEENHEWLKESFQKSKTEEE